MIHAVNIFRQLGRPLARRGSGRGIPVGHRLGGLLLVVLAIESRPRRSCPAAGLVDRGARPHGCGTGLQWLVRRAADRHRSRRQPELQRVGRLARPGVIGIGGIHFHERNDQYDRSLHLCGVGDHPARVRSAQLRDYLPEYGFHGRRLRRCRPVFPDGQSRRYLRPGQRLLHGQPDLLAGRTRSRSPV